MQFGSKKSGDGKKKQSQNTLFEGYASHSNIDIKNQ